MKFNDTARLMVVKVPLSNPKHPVWRLLELSAVCGMVTLVLWSNASDFDGGEIKGVIQLTLLYLAGRWGVPVGLRKWEGRKRGG